MNVNFYFIYKTEILTENKPYNIFVKIKEHNLRCAPIQFQYQSFGTNFACTADTALSASSASIITEILISDVEIILILIFLS